MKPETTISLVKELDKIRSIKSRNSYTGAWCGFIFALIGLAKIFMVSFKIAPENGTEVGLVIPLVVTIIVLLESFYVIVRHLNNKKYALLIEAILETNKSEII